MCITQIYTYIHIQTLHEERNKNRRINTQRILKILKRNGAPRGNTLTLLQPFDVNLAYARFSKPYKHLFQKAHRGSARARANHVFFSFYIFVSFGHRSNVLSFQYISRLRQRRRTTTGVSGFPHFPLLAHAIGCLFIKLSATQLARAGFVVSQAGRSSGRFAAQRDR